MCAAALRQKGARWGENASLPGTQNEKRRVKSR
jgi:hypothetical protein